MQKKQNKDEMKEQEINKKGSSEKSKDVKKEEKKTKKEGKKKEVSLKQIKKELDEIKKQNEVLISEVEKSNEEKLKYRDAAVSLKSDFENYKDYVEREKRDIEKKSKESVIKQLINPFQKLSISLKYKDSPEFGKAIEMVYRDFVNAFEKSGLKFISPEKGSQFDPFEHEVIEKFETDEVKEYHVYDVQSVGYKLNNIVVEPARVVVAVKPKEKKEENKKIEKKEEEVKQEENKEGEK